VNPANYPASFGSANILAVAAVDNQGSLADFSAFGNTSVDISAPGVSILSSIPAVPANPAAALASVGSSGGKALISGFGADEIGDATKQASYFTKAFQAVGRGTQEVVLVDDDLSEFSSSYPDVAPTISAAIQSATGSAPEQIDAGDGDGPVLSQLSGKTVVWATGQACDSDDGTCFFGGSSTTLTANDQATLTFNGASGTAFAGEAYTFNSSTAFAPFHDKVAPASSTAVSQGSYPAIPATWESWDGTSMATPHVTGVAALVASKYPSLLSKPTAIKKIIMDTGKPLSATANKTVTGDMADAQAALFPRVTAVSPAAGKTGVARGTNIRATFSEAMNATTINRTTFTLIKDGTTTKINATVTYDTATKRATLNPSANLAANTVYKATVKGGSTGVKNPLGDPMFTSKGWEFTTGAS
jgi:subtilisin family serine protease